MFSILPTDTWGPALNKHRVEAKYPLLPDSQTVESFHHSDRDSKSRKKGRSNKAFDASGDLYGDFRSGYPPIYQTKYIVEPSVLRKDTVVAGVTWTRGENVPLPYSFETSI